MNIYQTICSKKGKKTKKFAVLIDPDKIKQKQLLSIIEIAANNVVDFFFVGGSLLTDDNLEITIKTIKGALQYSCCFVSGKHYADK